MQTKIPNFEDIRKESFELPRWIIVLMKAYEEYLKEQRNKPEAFNGKSE
jgi:hypothetical protein